MQARQASINGPDFICIGMPKAGTGWLYDQLSHHPDFWMPPAKELHYLDRSKPRLKNSVQLLDNWGKASRRAKRNGLRWGEQERAFLERVVSSVGQPMDVGRYANFFEYKNDRLSGDISPGYCSLEESVISEIASTMPLTKILLLVREPIARAWSRICMANRDGEFDVQLLDDPPGFADFIRKQRYIQSKSFPTGIIGRWKTCAPAIPFRVVLFDEIVRRPTETMQDILSFIGGDPAKAGALPADYNRKSKTRKLQMPEQIKAVLIDYFADEIRCCADLLGGAGRAWPALYGL